MNKSPILAFFLALIPGFGHMYLGRKIRGFLYALFFFGFIGLAMLITIVSHGTGEAALIPLFLSVLIWGVNMLDMIITLLMNTHLNSQKTQSDGDTQQSISLNHKENERFFTILLSFVPGVGHFHLGLPQRGLTLLSAFLGSGIMIVFVSMVLNIGGLLIFLLALPVIWIYGMFDCIQLLNLKDNGETLEDRTILEDLDRQRQSGKKSKVVATVLGIFPGAGHMYLGLQRRGLQLMVGFLLSIYVLDVLRLSVFLFLIPVIWFFSFFDTLQQASRAEEGFVEDVPVIKYFANHQRWLGIALILLGCFYLMDDILMPALAPKIKAAFQIDLYYFYTRFFQMFVVCFLLIGGGIKLLMGSKSKKEEEEV
ncbi:DUF6677 family protein [Pontibacillus marinus]|uniref:Multi-TM2 domain-containing protein n=1 Tax=Pontibacillus marinus BH030004 = DSM 16465 TaxID=1385511 RepID=A0A0A5GAY2_9BACI|nr:hypothetical protein [Pontibacillus marinus]KGX90326.1 multi-TM2 domain-containing protein [Pontibacillus marinus BH030004 = DSM 16465]